MVPIRVWCCNVRRCLVVIWVTKLVLLVLWPYMVFASRACSDGGGYPLRCTGCPDNAKRGAREIPDVSN